VQYRVQGTTVVQSTHLTPAAAAWLNQLQVAPPQRLLAVERSASFWTPRDTHPRACVSRMHCAHISQPCVR